VNVDGDRDDHDNTLLITAAQNGLKCAVKLLLLRKGADMNARVRVSHAVLACV
jgi:hypothetical protein